MKPGLRTTVVLLGALCLAPGCASESGSRADKRTSSTTSTTEKGASSMKAADCGDLAAVFEADTQDAITASRMRCGTMKVPVDHAKPDGSQITIAFGRFVATGPKSERLGTLMVNPGGPGGSGIEYLATGIDDFPAELTARFDIVAFDPRGVGASTQMHCYSQAQLKKVIEADPIEDPERAAATALDEERAFRDGCIRKNEDLFLHIGTDQVVADLEDLRVALGNEPLNFYGMSYGSAIGAGYLSRYPQHVRAVVLDGSLNSDRSLVTRTRGQVTSIARAFRAFTAHCAATPACPLNPDPEATLEKILAEFREGMTLPSANSGEKRFGSDELETALVTSLYEPMTWEATADAVFALTQDDSEQSAIAVKVLSGFAAQQTGKRSDGSYDNGVEIRMAVTCSDAKEPITRAEAVTLDAELTDIIRGTPLEQVHQSNETSEMCTQTPTGNALRMEQTGLGSKALVIGNANDPVTPIEFAQSMARALGDVPLITYAGNGHTAGLRVDCVTEQLVDFFVDTGSNFSAKDCPQDSTEFDLFQELESSFDENGWDESGKDCAIGRIREVVSPLELLAIAPNEEEGPVFDAIRNAALACVNS